MKKELLFESDHSKVILVRKNGDDDAIQKILNVAFPSQKLIKQFFNEYEILKEVDIPNTRKALSAGRESNQYVITLEYVKGVTLEAYSRIKHTFEQKLIIASKLTHALSDFHCKGIIHQDLSNTNILVNTSNFNICIIDLELSSRFDTKLEYLGNPENLQGTLKYISPEQTGRMNRKIDYRTDLYSLGAILYEFFAGSLPFENTDALSLVHAHIAIAPKSPDLLNQDIPEVLSKIILKLLSKNAENRYQSADGLAHDLDRCLEDYRNNGKIDSFPIATHDHHAEFRINQKLYGRDEEIASLYKIFDYITSGPSELVLVGGYSGTGKSSLVHEIHRTIAEKRGIFIEGKFDQFQRGLPYFAINQALESFVEILLSENEERLSYFKSTILKAVGEEGKVLTDIIRSLEKIIGTQPEVAEVGGAETQNRFNYVFRKFINSICSSEHPVVLFIDDLQWSDSASLDLLTALLTDKESSHLMCICAYRDNEVDASHPFVRAVEEMRDQEVNIHEITLQNLSLNNVQDLISDSTDLLHSQTLPLTELVHQKTGGNAFFVNQFIKTLYEEKHLFFDVNKEEWSWNLEDIKSQNLTDDIITLMSGKIQRLPKETQELIKLAACVGSSFGLSTLSFIAAKDEEACEKILVPALSEGLIEGTEVGFHFSHDRIQQAAYKLIPSEDRPPLHLKIGRLLIDQLSKEALEVHLFDVVNQLNLGAEIMSEVEEKQKLCELNLRAGKKAKESSAFLPALQYLKEGIELLETNHWQNQYEMSLEFFSEASEAAFLSSNFEEMESYIKEVEVNGKDILSKLKPLEIRIHAMKAENNLTQALANGFDLLDQLGEKLPRKPNKLQIVGDLIKTLASLRGKSNEDILQLPTMEDPYKAAAMRICAVIAPSSYWGNPDVFPFIIWRLLRLSLNSGNRAVSAFGYATHGVIAVGIFNQFKTGMRFADLGLKILDKYKAKEWIAQVYTAIYALVVIWNKHVDKTLKPLQESYHIGLETGSIEFACVNANIYCIHAFFIGKPLAQIEEETLAYSISFKGYKQGVNGKYNEIYRQAMHSFMGLSENPTILTGDAMEENAIIESNRVNNDRTGTFFIFFHKMMLQYHFGEIEAAWENAKKAKELLDAVLAKLEVAYFHFYEGLIASELVRMNLAPSIKSMRSILRKNIQKMKSWAKAAPENFKHKQQLLQAELHAMNSQYDPAVRLYEKSAKAAQEQRYISEEALTYERSAVCYEAMENQQLRDFYLNKAVQCYLEWGGTAKADELEKRYPQSIFTQSGKSSSMGSSSGTGTTVRDLDTSSILKASLSISQEIVMSKLLQRMMGILIENLGATKGDLVLLDEGKMYIEIETNRHGESIHVLEHLPAQNSGLIPEKIIAYTIRTGEQLVLENATNHSTFASDPYTIKNGTTSVISFPILQKGKVMGVLYFENDLATGAFTDERLQLLTLLSGQIATSLENASLYESLERKVIDRTAQLQDQKKKSDELLLNILPASTAEELKKFGTAKPRKFEQITVMFTDFKDFTRLSNDMSPEELVDLIDTYFKQFDHIMERHNVEKIKTIGDSYMCAGGLNFETDHAKHVIDAAFDIKKYMEEQKKVRIANGEEPLAIRIGIHSGPVVAGVVGFKKFAYDIWGDTVNTASRMESNCGPWNINISGATHEIVESNYSFFHRGKIDVKNKGLIDMYYVLEKQET